MENLLIDPTFFDDVINEFAFEYDWYVVNGFDIDDLGRKLNKFDQKKIVGSLQPQSSSLNQSTERGQSVSFKYNFYCKSLYRIDIGDFIFYKNRFLHVDGVTDLDEFGVRSCTLTMINLNDYKDFKAYISYLNGETIV